MKYFLFLALVSISAFAENPAPKTAAQPAEVKEGTEPVIRIDTVRSVDFNKKEAMVTFWGTNTVFRMPATSAHIPCLENAKKSNMKVALKLDDSRSAIDECRLYNGGVPQFK